MRLWRAKERRVTTARVTFNGAVLAESDQTVVIEGNHYFPPKSVKWEHLTENASHTTCWWKGEASYYDIKVDGEVSASASLGGGGGEAGPPLSAVPRLARWRFCWS